MDLDWDRVKKQTLWSYEDLLGKLQAALAYNFVQEHYNHTMAQAQLYARRIREGYLQNRGETVFYIDTIGGYLYQLEKLPLGGYSDLVEQVATRQTCVAFLRQTDFEFDALIQVLNYLLRWVLPFRTPLREYMDVDHAQEISYLKALKEQKIASNLDLLEAGRMEAGRDQLSSATGIPAADLIVLVHKADISRLAYVRGKTVRHLCGGGYATLERIATADLAEMEKQMDAYYRTLGKSLGDFKAVIPLEWMIGGAQILPQVVDKLSASP
jgi:hypothetical protein